MNRLCRLVPTFLLATLLATTGCDKQGADKQAPDKAPDKSAKGGEAGSGKGGGKGGKGGRREAGPAVVRVETAVLKTLPAAISVVEQLTGKMQAEVYAKVVGRLSQLGPREGEAVRAGQVLFKVDRADPGESFLSTPVVSPISGWIGRWYATSLGEQVTTTAPVVSVVDDEVLRATVDLPTREWLLVNKDTAVSINVAGEDRQAKVVTVSRAGDASSGRGGVTVEVANPGRTWRSGMVARITLGLEPKPRIVIPTSGLTITDQGAFIYIVRDDKAARTPVDFTLIDADSVEITSGLKDGDQVVVAGTNMLSDQAAVRIVNAAEPPKGG